MHRHPLLSLDLVGLAIVIGTGLVVWSCAPEGQQRPAPAAVEYITTGGNAPNLWRIHLDADGVTCWAFSSGSGGGLSCIPDSQLRRPGPQPLEAPCPWVAAPAGCDPTASFPERRPSP